MLYSAVPESDGRRIVARADGAVRSVSSEEWKKLERAQRLPRSARSLLVATARSVLPLGTPGRNSLMALDGTAADGIAQAAVWTDQGDFARVSSWLARRLPAEPPRLWRRNLVEPERGLPGAAMAAEATIGPANPDL